VDFQISLLVRITLKLLVSIFPYFANIHVSVMEKVGDCWVYYSPTPYLLWYLKLLCSFDNNFGDAEFITFATLFYFECWENLETVCTWLISTCDYFMSSTINLHSTLSI